MLSKNIKKQPAFFKYIPWLKRHQGTTIATTIYLRSDIYENLLSKNPSAENVAVLLHEETHDLFNPSFRFNEELLANKTAFRYLKSKKRTDDLHKKALILSGWLYLWPVSYEYALEKINPVRV